MIVLLVLSLFVFFFKQKTAYEMRISDWSSDVCSSDLPFARPVTISGGYAYTDQSRNSMRRDFRFTPELGSLGLAASQERPDYLLSDYNIQTYGNYLREAQGVSGAGACEPGLRIHAGYPRLHTALICVIAPAFGQIARAACKRKK